jgi:hypothetical protein
VQGGGILARSMQAPPGPQILAGKYQLIRQLGRGGMGSVWYAEHLTLKSPVAIKLIEPDIAMNPEALARFLREAQAAASLRSPHVVQILDHGVDGGVPFIAMEVLDGESLADRLTRVGKLPPSDVAWIITHVGRAIGRAHEAGVVHRDLKPDNIYLVRNDEEELAKVLDFGVAKSTAHGLGAAASSATRTGAILGTPYYMSPEQAEGAKTLDHRTDIWAMGVIAFEAMMGRRPFEAETLGGLLLAICTRPMLVPSQCGPVPNGFDAWFARACCRDVDQRFASAKEAATELRKICTRGADHTGAHAAFAAGAMGTGHGPAVAANSVQTGSNLQAFNATTGQLSTAELSTVPKRSNGPIAAVLGLVVLAIVGGVIWGVRTLGASADTAASAEAPSSQAAAPAAPPAAAPEITPAPSPTPSIAGAPVVAPSADVASATPAASSKNTTLAKPTAATVNRARPNTTKPATLPATKPVESKPATTTTAKKKVDLGI